MNPPARSELMALTSLRGLAAMFVLAHHFMFVLLQDVAKAIPSKLFLKSYLWVDLFFVLSGFVLAYVYQEHFKKAVVWADYRRFMVARFARVYPLHIFMLGLFVILEALQWLLVAQHFPKASLLATPFTGSETIFSLLTNFLLLQTLHWNAYWNQPAWSISAEWLVYLTVPLLIRHVLLAHTQVHIIFAAAMFIVLIAIEWHFGNLGLDFAGWPMLLRCFGECALGVIALRVFQQGGYARLASGGMALPALVANVLLLALPIPAVISVLGFVWLVVCAARVPASSSHYLHWPPLIYLGRISFAIYMVHWFVLELLRAAFILLTGQPVAEFLTLGQQIFVFIAAIPVVLLLAHCLYNYVEIPCRKKCMMHYNDKTI